ncbi:MAG: hypothetical protein DRQ60_04575, partial [Gammaproteobacteria bacterium]
MSRFGFVILSVALISGCALTPDYERPALNVPGTYVTSHEQGESIANLPWWEVFQDDQIEALIRVALAENKDLSVSLSRVAQADAQLTSVRANQFPFLDITGGAGRGKQSQLLVPGAGT